MSVAIVGGGAAGMMAAATLVESGYTDTVFLFDKNPHLGAKVIISGGGRCNVTTSFYKKEVLKTKYPRGWDLIQEAIVQFGPKKIYNRFEDHGVPLKIEKDGRVFPVSNKGKDVVGVFERMFEGSDSIHIKLQEKVASITKQDGMFEVLTDKGMYIVDKLILATGGNAYRHTGSTGDGYAFVQDLGHTITPLGPSLNSFQTDDTRLQTLSGVSFSQSMIIAQDGKEFVGPFLLTHFGISGPVVFAYSAHVTYEDMDQQRHLKVIRRPYADKSYDHIMYMLQEARRTMPKKRLITVLKMYIPDRFADALLQRYGWHATATMNELSKDVMHHISMILGKGIELILTARRAGDEFVTAGGVPANEVNPMTMESRICPGLYIVGELLDVDGVTGGYNLTSSRATGRLAGINIKTNLY